MAFLVVFNGDDAPGVEDHRLRLSDAKAFERLDTSREIAMLWSDREEESEAGRVRHASGCGLQLMGRIRLDRRDELCVQLGAPISESDAALVLRAYIRWGEGCVDHLRGDFCFVLWDESRRRVFCARDQIGVRPLYYARAKETWFIGDSLDIVARCSCLADELDDVWIADFLLESFCLDFDRTVYAHVKRLPPAHALAAFRGGAALMRYWSLELDEPIFFKRRGDYLDYFHETLARSIRDRLPEGTVGVTMSGGLDSTTLAAKAVEITGDASRVVAFTSHFERLIPDNEAQFSSLAAARLGISQKFVAMDQVCELHADAPAIWTAEPGGPAAEAPARRLIETEMASEATVWLFGEGPDNALTFEWLSYLRWLAGRGAWRRLFGAIGQYAAGKPPREWLFALKRLSVPRSRPEPVASSGLPAWISRDFAKRASLAEREAKTHSSPLHGWRPWAMQSFSSPIWQRLFEHIDPVVSGSTLDYRHPYLDLEVLTFMLKTPPIPWARRKHLIREAMRGRLPDAILSREKTPLAVDPLAIVARTMSPPPLSESAALSHYVDVARLPADAAAAPGIDPLAKVRILNAWLEGRPR